GLARAGRAHDSQGRPGGHVERHIVQYYVAVVAERYVVEPDIAPDPPYGPGALAIGDLGLLDHHLAYAPHRSGSLLVQAHHPTQGDHRPTEHPQVPVE